MSSAPRIAVTVDFEDSHHGLRIAKHVSHLERDTAWILELFHTLNVRATFFVLGEVADSHPLLLKQIAAENHEIACHGATHEFLRDLTPRDFAFALRATAAKLEDIVGAPVIGFRAPFFSVEPRTHWSLEVLAQCGFRYDASIYPAVNDRYGWPGAPTCPARHAPTGLIVFPVPLLHSALPIGFSGGAYLRLLPHWLVAHGLRSQARSKQPGMIYFHPWEISFDLEWRREAGLRANLTRHLFRKRMRPQLQRLLAAQRSRAGTMRSVIEGVENLPPWNPTLQSVPYRIR